MSGHPLYARWRILEKAVETVVLATAAGDADLEAVARELAFLAAERLEVPADLLLRMENDRARTPRSATKASGSVLYFTGTQGRVPG